MRDLTRSGRWMFIAAVAGLSGWFFAFSIRAEAQSQGNNAVYNSNGICSSSTSCGFSGAFIDASTFGNNKTDLCAVLYNVLKNIVPTTGAVIDARGLPGKTGTSMTCAAGTTPWNNGSTTVSPPSTILLPAGAILIPKSWILPANTHLIGEGDNPGSAALTAGTTIQACNSLLNSCSFADAAMIQFGSSSATGISVENITLDGQGQSKNGIVNQYSSYLTYVDRVTLFQVLGVGLLIENGASYSGPYTNITFDTGTYSGLSQTVCAQILTVTGGTHGIRGLTCTSRTNDATNAVLLDSSNNSIEDVAIAGFYSGIVLGSQAPARANVLINISDSTKACTVNCPPAPVNMIHIEPYTTNGQPNVSDLAITGASNDRQGTLTILDDLTATDLTDGFVGMYALGKSSSGGYSRFTTSPNISAATWAIGQNAPLSSCSTGSLYSCIGASCTYALYGCVDGAWKYIK